MRSTWMVGLAAAVAVGAVGGVGAAVTFAAGTQLPSVGADPVLVGNSQRTDSSRRVVGLTGDRGLVSFRADRPADIGRLGTVKGLTGDSRLIGIDYRVQDGKLYGVGDSGGVYTIDTSTVRAAKVSQLTVALDGQSFGVDFNPAANRLRVVSDTGQNLRHNIDDPAGAPTAGTTAMDTMLTTPPATAAVTGVSGAAYTNNDLDARTATTLFDLNVSTDQLAAQSPANQGELAPTGGLTVDADGDAGLDVFSGLRGGVSVANTAYATLKVDGRYRFYQVDVLTGRADRVGTFPSGTAVRDIAVVLAR